MQALARTLGVTKGSFYWHFRDLAELRGEMAAHWRRVSTVRFIARLEGLGLSPRDTLVAALAGEQRPASDLGPGIRAWALTDAAVAAEVERMGVSRTSYLADLLRRGGLSPRVARERAPFLQAALLGLESGGAPPGGPEGAASVIDALLRPPGDRR